MAPLIDAPTQDDDGLPPDMLSCDGPDEDGDGRGDACDVCPGDADNGMDSDGDGVGDVCDPSPTTAEHIVFFEGFNEMPSWTIAGPWRLVGGDFISDSGSGVISNATIPDPVPGKVSYLVTKLTIGAQFDPVGSTSYIGLVRQLDLGPADSNVRCLISRADGATDAQFGLRDTGSGTPLRSEVVYPYVEGQVERFQFRRSGEDYVCSSATETRTGSSAITATEPHIGIRTRSGAATYHWVMLLSE